jgi:hypothetical protein
VLGAFPQFHGFLPRHQRFDKAAAEALRIQPYSSL